MDRVSIHAHLPAALSSASYNAANQLTQWGGSTLTYDLNGNLTSDGTHTYTWNARNQLAGGYLQYDALGRRTRNPAGTSFLYDGLNPIQELSGSTVTANLLTSLGIDEIFSRTDSTGTFSFLTDRLGSTAALSDSTGTLQTQYTYAPFGATTTTGLNSTNPNQFTGRENDGGLYYNRARYYSPTFQRFISEDPAGVAGGANLYEYASDDPISYFDPLGLDKRLSCAAQYGNNHSVASWFGAQNNFAANLVGGNSVSGLVNLGLFVAGDTTPTVSQLASLPLKGAAQGIPVPPGNPGLSGATGQLRGLAVQGAVAGAYNAIAGVGEETIELGITAAGTIATPVAQISTETLSNVAFGVGVAKFLFDLSTVGYGYVVACK